MTRPSADGLTTPVDLSIIIPTHNGAATIVDQLDALLAQETTRPFEVVVVLNRCSDATATVVEPYASERVRVVQADDKPNANYARNAGIRAARAEKVSLVDDDDVVGPGWVQAMCDALDEKPLTTGVLELDRLNPRWLADSRGRADERGAPDWYGIFPVVRTCNLAMRHEVWEKLGPFDEDSQMRGADDVAISLSAWLAGIDVTFVSDAVVHYRYRRAAADLWHQGLRYGIARPLVVKQLRAAGRRTPRRVAGWRSWLWLPLHLPDLRSSQGRAAWCWVAGNRIGQLSGSIRHRTVFL